MPDFAYSAKNDLGITIQGHLNALNEEDLAERLGDKGLFLVDSHAIRAAAQNSFFERITRKDIITFSVHLATVLSAGVPLLTGLEDLINQTEKEGFRSIVEEVMQTVQGGSSLSDALGKHPTVFSDLYVNMVRAGEATGNVEGVLTDLVSFLEWQDDLAAKVKEALVYPAILLSAVTLLVFFLFIFVIPRFTVIFSRQNIQLPIVTRVILQISQFMSTYWHVIIGTILVLWFLFRTMRNTIGGRFFLDSFKLKLPVFGELLRKIAISRFSHNFAALLRAGVDLPKALSICEKIMGNAVLAEVIRTTLLRVQEGEPVSKSLASSGQFPPIVIRMLGIGERTGALETTLGKVNQFYDREIPATIRRIFAIMEPVILILLGGVVVTVAISVFLPMYQLVQILQVYR